MNASYETNNSIDSVDSFVSLVNWFKSCLLLQTLHMIQMLQSLQLLLMNRLSLSVNDSNDSIASNASIASTDCIRKWIKEHYRQLIHLIQLILSSTDSLANELEIATQWICFTFRIGLHWFNLHSIIILPEHRINLILIHPHCRIIRKWIQSFGGSRELNLRKQVPWFRIAHDSTYYLLLRLSSLTNKRKFESCNLVESIVYTCLLI